MRQFFLSFFSFRCVLVSLWCKNYPNSGVRIPHSMCPKNRVSTPVFLCCFEDGSANCYRERNVVIILFLKRKSHQIFSTEMKNFAGSKLLSSCTPGELPVGTCFSLLLDNVPVRRGVVVLNDSVDWLFKCRAWFALKSSSPSDLHELRAGFTVADAARLMVQSIPRYEEFIKRVPPAVRAKAGGVRQSAARKRASEIGGGDDVMYPDIHPQTVHVPTTHVDGPGCSPPPSPKAKVSKPTLTSEVAVLAQSVSALQRSVQKMSKRLKRVLDAHAPSTGQTSSTWDTS